MNFDFQSIKPVIAREFDRVMEHYPTDMTMVAERDRKGTHPDLVVGIWGYSALFGVLSRDMQDEGINRTEY